MNKHTPEPWVLMDTTNADGATEYEVEAPDYETVALVYASENMAANAALIAAAPELLDTLKDARMYVEAWADAHPRNSQNVDMGAWSMLDDIHAVLAKAEGR